MAGMFVRTLQHAAVTIGVDRTTPYARTLPPPSPHGGARASLTPVSPWCPDSYADLLEEMFAKRAANMSARKRLAAPQEDGSALATYGEGTGAAAGDAPTNGGNDHPPEDGSAPPVVPTSAVAAPAGASAGATAAGSGVVWDSEWEQSMFADLRSVLESVRVPFLSIRLVHTRASKPPPLRSILTI